MTLPAKAHWKAASDKEIASLKKNNVYTLVPATAVPAGHKIVGSRWVYKFKAEKSHEGRVIVLEWGQVPGVDCGGTFAPVCRLQSIRMVLAIAAEFDFECWQLDYNTAFLNAKVEEEVYVKMAPGYEEFSNDGVPMSCSTVGEGGDTTIPSPGRSPKQPLPGIGLHDFLHGRQAFPESISFHQGVGQICPR